VCTWIDNQHRHDVVTTRVRSCIRSLHHQRQDLHQSTYLYLSEDQDATSHHVGLKGLLKKQLAFHFALALLPVTSVYLRCELFGKVWQSQDLVADIALFNLSKAS
jgi:hypothetical protein